MPKPKLIKKILDLSPNRRRALVRQQLFALNQIAMVYIADKSGIISFVNNRFCEISGYNSDEIVGNTQAIFESGYHSPLLFSQMEETILAGETWHGTLKLKKKDGTFFWIEGVLTPYQEKKGSIISQVGVFIDITEKKKNEELLSQQRMQSIQNTKMSSLGEMAGGIAHEINNPLSIIHGKAEVLLTLLEQGDIPKETLKKHLSTIESTSMRIAAIVKGLRTFSRNADFDPFEKSSVRQIIEDSLAICQQRMKNHGIRLTVKIDKDIEVECRPVQISQVLINLLNNSFDAIQSLVDSWIEIETKTYNTYVEICFTDSGSGIPPHIVSRMMEPFFTTKTVGKGTGLGLSISKGIIEEHKGQFIYDTKAPHTRFVITLPLEHESVKNLNPAA